MKQNNKEIEKWRLTKDKYCGNDLLVSDETYGNNGVFLIPYKNVKLFVVASDQCRWEHVSIHVECVKKKRTPFWEEMCFIKDLFWREDEEVIQFHPRKADYINCHPYTLHLWKNQDMIYELPPAVMV